MDRIKTLLLYEIWHEFCFELLNGTQRDTGMSYDCPRSILVEKELHSALARYGPGSIQDNAMVNFLIGQQQQEDIGSSQLNTRNLAKLTKFTGVNSINNKGH